jgi:hypothetical protein
MSFLSKRLSGSCSTVSPMSTENPALITGGKSMAIRGLMRFVDKLLPNLKRKTSDEHEDVGMCGCMGDRR